MGPMTHVFTDTAIVDGILVPTAYWTQGPSGGVAGRHVARNWNFSAEFDESRMEMPANAAVDRSAKVPRRGGSGLSTTAP